MEPWGGGHGALLWGRPQGDPMWGSITSMGASWQGERQPGGEWGWHGAVAQLGWHGVTRHGGTGCDMATRRSLPCPKRSTEGQQLAHVCTLVQPPHAHFCPTRVPPTQHIGPPPPPHPRAGLGVLLTPMSVFGIFGFSQGWGETKVPRGSVGP